jgi:hypothetical protein
MQGASYDNFKRAVIGQESGGRYGVPNAQGSGAMGVGQVMPDTAKSLAARVGLPYRPDLMAGSNAEARDYQNKITEAAMQEAWSQGSPRTAAMYYHGGSNRGIWGPKTHQYADEVMARMGAQPQAATGYSVVKDADRSTWDKRADGSAKGTGWLGVLRRPDGNVSTEISAGININGKEMDVPLLVPGLTKPELDYLMKHEPDLEKNPRFFRDMPRSILGKAEAFAKQRIAQGKSPFKQDGE